MPSSSSSSSWTGAKRAGDEDDGNAKQQQVRIETEADEAEMDDIGERGEKRPTEEVAPDEDGDMLMSVLEHADEKGPSSEWWSEHFAADYGDTWIEDERLTKAFATRTRV